MLPNEIAYVLLMATLFLRLAFCPSLPIVETGAFALFLTFSLWLYMSRETLVKKRIKWTLPIVSVPLLYFSLHHLMPILGTPKQDLLLQRCDDLLVGGSLSLKLRFFAHPLLTECMYICYMLFFAYVITTLVIYLKNNEVIRKSFYSGLFTIYWVGFLSYSFMPGDGPYLALKETLGEPLREGIYFSAPIYDFIYYSNNHADVFPSLHCAISAFCLFFDLRHNRRRFWLSLPLCIMIWISTLYLSYHYFVDLCVGFFLTYLALILTKQKQYETV